VTNPLGAAIADAIAQGKTLPFTNNYINGDDWSKLIGPEIQKYIVKKESRADLAKFIQNYYASQK
jgi:raffinose/stachyose/melibiose transport system substrate-binding protein